MLAACVVCMVHALTGCVQVQGLHTVKLILNSMEIVKMLIDLSTRHSAVMRSASHWEDLVKLDAGLYMSFITLLFLIFIPIPIPIFLGISSKHLQHAHTQREMHKSKT